MKNTTALAQFNPSEVALAYVKKFDSYRDAWDACERGDWMIWIAIRLKVDLKLLIKTAALCVLEIRPLMTDERSIEAYEVALKFSEGKAMIEELTEAAHYAAVAETETETAATYYATAAAYYLVKATEAAHYAAVAAANYAVAEAAEAAHYVAAAAAAAAVASKNESKSQIAAICRQVLTEAVFEKVEKLI